jgi:tetratricopeptide (TPR) repeat protein
MKSKLLAVAVIAFTLVLPNATPGRPGSGKVSLQEGKSAARGEPRKASEKQSPAGSKYYAAGNRNSYSNPELAVEQYKKAIAEGYDTVELRLSLGKVLQILKRPEEAFEQYRAAIQMDGENSRPHFALALALLNSERYEEALREFEIVKELDAEDYKLGLFSDHIAKCLDYLGRYEDALEEYDAALRCGCSGETEEALLKRRIAELKALLGRSQP